MVFDAEPIEINGNLLWAGDPGGCIPIGGNNALASWADAHSPGQGWDATGLDVMFADGLPLGEPLTGTVL